MPHILLVDDEEAVCWSLKHALQKEGHSATTSASAEDALVQIDKHCPDAIVLDVRLPGMDGLTALEHLREKAHIAPVIVITAYGNLNTAVRAVECGAFDYLVKPFDLDQALDAIGRAVQQRSLQSTNEPESVQETPAHSTPPEEFVGKSPAMQTVFKRIALVAPRDSCVLITGESGSGKELVARAVHRYSSWREGPFLPVHVAALNPSLVESELFGHVKGAFTGASQTKPGLLTLAQGGTVFFDELAEIPLSVQVKLLRVLDHGEVLPVGAKQAEKLNVRILTATHQDLQRKISEGTFRHDLFFRLNVFQIHLPPLRERGEDILPLAEFFLHRFEPRALPLLPQTIEFLQQQPWLGNVRELANALEHAVIVARGGPLLPVHFPRFSHNLGPLNSSEELSQSVRHWVENKLSTEEGKTPEDLYAELLACVEPALLDEVMRRVQGNRWAAAQWLGLNRATVRKKLGVYDMTDAYRSTPSEES